VLLDGLTRLARTVPLPAGYRLADAASEIHLRASASRRRAVRDNLAALGVSDPAAVRRVYRHFGRTLLEFLRGPYVPELPTRFEGWERLVAARARGRGVLAVMPHTGNWAQAGAVAARRGIPVAAVAAVQLRESWTPALRERQERDGVRILPPGVASWRAIPRLLAENRLVALLADGDVFRGALSCPTPEGTVLFPTGPARLALRTGAALLPAWSLREDDGTIRVAFGEEIAVDPSDPAAVERVTLEILARLLATLRAHPDQWLLFRRFFDAAPARAGTARAPAPTAAAAPAVPVWGGTP